ncbi:N-hydroxyarylamine O-acetyltransferase [compost metagenome]
MRGEREMLTINQTNDYLNRLGIERQLPTKDFLFDLHRAHVEKIAWQTIDIFAGKPVSIDFKDSTNHIINNGGGYCFHLNGAFSLLLRSLGYNVSLHRAGVQSHGHVPRIDSYHLGLSVSITNENLRAQTWLVDVGLGDMPYEPIPLVLGEYKQDFHTYKITKSSVAASGWRLEHDPQGAFIGVDIDPEDVKDIEEFIPKHEQLSSAPDSTWVDLLLVRNRHKTGSNELKGCVFSQRSEIGITKSEVTNRTSWFEILKEVFGEPLNHFSELEKDELWSKALKAHEEWKRNQPDH